MKIVFLDQNSVGDADLSDITQQGQLRCFNSTAANLSPLECIADADVVITNKVKLDRHTLQHASQLKLICVAATGYNNIDINAAQDNAISVCNVAGYSTQSVTQHVFALLLNWSIKLSQYQQDVQTGKWSNSDIFCLLDHPIFELGGKTLAIFGYGDIGQSVEKVAQAFGMKVIIAERENATETRANRTPYWQAVGQADVISLHCPLTEQNTQMVNADFLQKMKQSAILINTARGGLIDEIALSNALKNNDIQAALLDGLSQEPPPVEHALLQNTLKNVIITPHTAWASKQARQTLVNEIALNIAAFKQGEKRNTIT